VASDIVSFLLQGGGKYKPLRGGAP
jgi:hypothetical protein